MAVRGQAPAGDPVDGLIQILKATGLDPAEREAHAMPIRAWPASAEQLVGRDGDRIQRRSRGGRGR